MIGIGFEIIVFLDLADVASIAGCVERVRPVCPVKRFVHHIYKMAHTTQSCVEPFLLPHIVGDWKCLQASSFHGRQEVEHIFAPHSMCDPVLFLTLRTRLGDPS